MFSLGRPLVVTSVAAQTRGQLLLVTRDGEAFQGEVKVQRSGAEVTAVQVKRVPHIHRAVTATSDPKGRNFAIVQVWTSLPIFVPFGISLSHIIKHCECL
jgi:hypothetical protein